MSDAFARAAAYRERASQMKQKADVATLEELRRSWLTLERQWRRMADAKVWKAIEESPPLSPREPD